jgi:hypothetical protein
MPAPSTAARPVARPAEPVSSWSSGSTSEPESGLDSGNFGSGGSERIKIGERPPEQPWPGGSQNR